MNKILTSIVVFALAGCTSTEPKQNNYPTPDRQMENTVPEWGQADAELENPLEIINDSVAVFDTTLDTLDYKVQIRIFGEGLKKELHFAIFHGEESKYMVAKWPLAVIDAKLKDYDHDLIPELYLVCNDEGTLSENYVQYFILNQTDSLAFTEIDLTFPSLNGRVLIDTFVFQNEGISRNIVSEVIDPMGTANVNTSIEYQYDAAGNWEVVD